MQVSLVSNPERKTSHYLFQQSLGPGETASSEMLTIWRQLADAEPAYVLERAPTHTHAHEAFFTWGTPMV